MKIIYICSCASTQIKECCVCRKNHRVWSCVTFLSLTFKDRFRMALSKGLCFQCLEAGHMAQSCIKPPRKHCWGRHQSSSYRFGQFWVFGHTILITTSLGDSILIPSPSLESSFSCSSKFNGSKWWWKSSPSNCASYYVWIQWLLQSCLMFS